MAIELFVKGTYPTGADALFEAATHFSDLIRATGRLSKFGKLPEVRMEGGRLYQTDFTILGLVECADFRIQIDKLCTDTRIMTSRVQCRSIPVWQHHLQITTTETGAVWTDRLVIDAGAMTRVVTSSAKLMYLHRHKRRGALAATSSVGKSYRVITPGIPIFQAAL